MGYSRAGFEVVGVDIARQRRYPFEFVLGDAILVPPCAHRQLAAVHRVGMHSHRSRTGVSRFVGVYGKGHHAGDRDLWARAMGIDWMTLKELSQALPPAYTELIGHQLMAVQAVTA